MNTRWPYSVVVITLDSESSDPSSNLGRAFAWLHAFCILFLVEISMGQVVEAIYSNGRSWGLDQQCEDCLSFSVISHGAHWRLRLPQMLRVASSCWPPADLGTCRSMTTGACSCCACPSSAVTLSVQLWSVGVPGLLLGMPRCRLRY